MQREKKAETAHFHGKTAKTRWEHSRSSQGCTALNSSSRFSDDEVKHRGNMEKPKLHLGGGRGAHGENGVQPVTSGETGFPGIFSQ